MRHSWRSRAVILRRKQHPSRADDDVPFSGSAHDGMSVVALVMHMIDFLFGNSDIKAGSGMQGANISMSTVYLNLSLLLRTPSSLMRTQCPAFHHRLPLPGHGHQEKCRYFVFLNLSFSCLFVLLLLLFCTFTSCLLKVNGLDFLKTKKTKKKARKSTDMIPDALTQWR